MSKLRKLIFHLFCLQNGQTALSIAQRLGYISVVETLKVVTEQEITTTTTTTIEEKYKVLAPESMQETFMSDSEDEGGKQKFQILFLLIFNTLCYRVQFWFKNTVWNLASLVNMVAILATF